MTFMLLLITQKDRHEDIKSEKLEGGIKSLLNVFFLVLENAITKPAFNIVLITFI